MNRYKIRRVGVLLLFFTSLPLFADGERFLIRTTAGMEPYGRYSSENWGIGNAKKHRNVSYGFTPGIEGYYTLNDVCSVGLGFKWQIRRFLFDADSDSSNRFYHIPVYAAGRFNILNLGQFKMYAILRLGYSIIDTNSQFRNIWLENGEALTSTGNGIYGSFNLGISSRIAERKDWNLGYSMDVGYSYYGASGTTQNDKSYPLSYQAFGVEFTLEWQF